MRLMLRTLLAERFKLAIRKEVQDMPDLRAPAREARRQARSSASRRRHRLRCHDGRGPRRRAHWRPAAGAAWARRPHLVRCDAEQRQDTDGGNPLSMFANTLSPLVQRVVVDRTGFVGTDDFELTVHARPLTGGASRRTGSGRGASACRRERPVALHGAPGTACLEARTRRAGPVEVLVIERAEQPTGN